MTDSCNHSVVKLNLISIFWSFSLWTWNIALASHYLAQIRKKSSRVLRKQLLRLPDSCRWGRLPSKPWGAFSQLTDLLQIASAAISSSTTTWQYKLPGSTSDAEITLLFSILLDTYSSLECPSQTKKKKKKRIISYLLSQSLWQLYNGQATQNELRRGKHTVPFPLKQNRPKSVITKTLRFRWWLIMAFRESRC